MLKHEACNNMYTKYKIKFIYKWGTTYYFFNLKR